MSPSTQQAKRYVILIEGAPPSNYSAWSPDLPGCAATASTLEEVEAEMKDAMAFHVEGLTQHGDPIPEGSGPGVYVALDAAACGLTRARLLGDENDRPASRRRGARGELRRHAIGGVCEPGRRAKVRRGFAPRRETSPCRSRRGSLDAHEVASEGLRRRSSPRNVEKGLRMDGRARRGRTSPEDGPTG